MAIFTKFFGRTVSDGASHAIGGSVRRTLDPLLQEVTNETWERYPNVPLEPGDAAEIVAEDVEQLPWGQGEAAFNGMNAERFATLVQAVLNAPGAAQLFELWRRDLISDADFTHGLGKMRLEPRWWSALRSLKNRLLAPADLANARQQGYIDEARQKNESELQGIDAERAELLFLLSGLPPGIEMGLEMLRRSIITAGEFAQLVREGHTKTKYTDELLALRNRVLSAPEYATLYLKGWITREQMNAGGALTGYDADAMDKLYLARGRPTSPTQGWNAWARDAPGPAGGQFEKDDFLRAIKQSDIRPEYGETLWALRFNYPSLFQLRRAVQDGSIDAARARRILHIQRYEDQDADGLIQSWTKATGAGVKALTASTLQAEYEGGFITQATLLSRLQTLGYSSAEANLYAELGDARRVISARTSTLSAIRTRYVSHRLSRDEMLAQLGKVQMRQEAKDRTVVEWDIQREATVTGLTAAQIRSAYRHLTYTREQALQMLDDLGWRADQAAVFLDTPAK